MTQNTNVNSALNINENEQILLSQLPRPYPDPEAWETTLKAGLASDPRRQANYDKYQKATRTADLDYLPIRMDVENVSRCNFRCTMCQISDLGPTYQRGRDMGVEEFKAFVDEQYGLIEIKLQGIGEPLLGRDDFFEMIRYARSKHIWVRTTNNGSLLHFNNNYKKLIDSGVNEVQISVDGATKTTFESIRHGSKFELVAENCKLLNNYCEKQGVLKTRMWTVLQDKNLAEFYDLVRLSAKLGFKRSSYTISLTDWGQAKWRAANDKAAVGERFTSEMAYKGIAIGKELGVEVSFWDITEKFDTASPDTLCQWPFQRGFISSDMRSVPCCMIGNPDVVELGDANNFIEVWNGESYREFRKAHLEGRIPKVCRACYKMNANDGKTGI